jgi:hypothetical protein
MAKQTMIELECKVLGRRMFTLEHATAILTSKYNRPKDGWYIPDGSEYKFENGVIVKRQSNDTEPKRYKRTFERE